MAYRASAAQLDRDYALRQHILRCALLRVSAGGFAALTMHALADDAGIATGSLYRHFRSKGEIAACVFSEVSQRELQTLSAIFQASNTASQRLRLGVAQFAERAWRRQQLAFALIAEPVEPQVYEQRLRYREAYAQLFSQLLEDGVRTGEFNVAPINLAAAYLVGAIAESLVGPLSPPARALRESAQPCLSLAVVSASLSTFCLRAVGAQESA